MEDERKGEGREKMANKYSAIYSHYPTTHSEKWLEPRREKASCRILSERMVWVLGDNVLKRGQRNAISST